MNNKIRVTAATLAVILLLTGHGAPSAPARSAEPGQADTAQIARLAGLCKLWGRVKFTHPYLAYRRIDWDAALIQTIPKVKAAGTGEEYVKALEYLLSHLKDPATRIIHDVEKADVGRSGPSAGSRAQPYVEKAADGTAIVVATDYDQLNSYQVLGQIRQAFKEAASSQNVVVDLRRLHGQATSDFSYSLHNALPVLLSRDVPVRRLRFLTHFGYSSYADPGVPYYSDLTTRSPRTLFAQGPPPGDRPRLAFIINRGTLDIYDVLFGAQDAGEAVIVQEGESVETAQGPVATMTLPPGIKATIRHAERLGEDGRTDFVPDRIIPVNASPEVARQEAIALLRDQTGAKSARPGNASVPPVPQAVSLAERSYREMVYPDESYRLLALFRFWNVVEYFFPYKNLMDTPWGQTLSEFIPKMMAAGNATEYSLAVRELATRLQDTHVVITAPGLGQYFGTHWPPVAIGYIENQTVITRLDPSMKEGTPLSVGDVILAIDGEDVTARRNHFIRYVPASTPLILQSIVNMLLLWGMENKPVTLKVKGRTGEVREVQIARTMNRLPPLNKAPSGPVYSVLPEGYGYVDMDRLTEADVPKALAAIEKTPGLILDMRRGPSGGGWRFITMLSRKQAVSALLNIPQYDGANGIFTKEQQYQMIYAPPSPMYSGKVVVLIHEWIQSSAEHACLYIEAGTDATFIGSPTSGANGNITAVYLPGGIEIRFTGMEVRHGDGRQLQRLGIQPHIEVRPTIEGLIQGRDEFLERAIKFLKDEPAKSR